MFTAKKIASYTIFIISVLLLPVMIYCYQWSLSSNKLSWKLFGYSHNTVWNHFDVLYYSTNILLLVFLVTTIILRVKPLMWFNILLIITNYILLEKIDLRFW
jgi:hypothetical protein